jgi:hypothetical protein
MPPMKKRHIAVALPANKNQNAGAIDAKHDQQLNLVVLLGVTYHTSPQYNFNK